MLGACVAAVASRRPIQSSVIVMLSIAVQEMMLAAWLIVKGFDMQARHVLSAAPVSTAPAPATS